MIKDNQVSLITWIRYDKQRILKICRRAFERVHYIPDMTVLLPPGGLASSILIDAIDDDHVQAIALIVAANLPVVSFDFNHDTSSQIKAGNHPCGLGIDYNDWQPTSSSR
jgi:hypothetical protein